MKTRRALLHRLVLLQLPEGTEPVRWRDTCQVRSGRPAAAGAARLILPGYGPHARITYPALLGVASVTWVYIAWCGILAWRHAVLDVTSLHRTHLAGLPMAWTARMQVGQLYLWVDAWPEVVLHVSCPMPRPGGVIYGHALDSDAQARPYWRHAIDRPALTSPPAE
jgi:hypothetical protein